MENRLNKSLPERYHHCAKVISTFTILLFIGSISIAYAQGDITAVRAGTGLSGGGETGDVTLGINIPLDLNQVSIDSIIKGTNNSTGSTGNGVTGITDAKKGHGVYGKNNNSKNFGALGSPSSGIYGSTNSTTGVYGKHTGSGNYGYLGGENIGISGYSKDGWGIIGTSENYTGVQGTTSGATSVGVSGNNSASGTVGYLGGPGVAVNGRHTPSGNWGSLGNAEFGVYGQSQNSTAVYGTNTSTQSTGHLGSSKYGVHGQTETGIAVYGMNSSFQNIGYLGSIHYGVYGETSSHKEKAVAVYGKSKSSGNIGQLGRKFYGVTGYSNTHTGVQGSSHDGTGIYGTSQNGHAGYFSGRVGIGMWDGRVNPPTPSDPAVRLSVHGGVDVVGNTRINGQATVTVLQITGGADLSEKFSIHNSNNSAPIPGTVVSIDSENPGKLLVSDKVYDRRVAGIVSGAGNMNHGIIMGQSGRLADGEYPVALTGRVYSLANTENGPIQPGDFLTTSGQSGYAMKVTDFKRAQGAILGKAMSKLESGQGLVLVLVNLQ